MRENRPVIALDFPTLEDVKAFLAKFPADEKLYVKIGMELYYAGWSWRLYATFKDLAIVFSLTLSFTIFQILSNQLCVSCLTLALI